MAFGERELCVFVLHSAGPDSYLALLRLARGMWRTGVICICITFCQTRQLLNIILIGPMAFRERVLCVFVLHSAGPDSYLTLLRLARGIWRRGEFFVLVLHSAGPDNYLAKAVTTRVSFIVRQAIWGPPSSHKVQGRAMVRVPGVAKLWLYLKMQKYIVYEMFVHMLLKWL